MLGKIKPDLQQNLFKTRLTELINMGSTVQKYQKYTENHLKTCLSVF
jgi:hypothetical protein